MTDPPHDVLATLELREERLTIERTREVSGRVEVRRERRVRTETVTVELVSEVLILSVKPGSGAVTLDGVLLPEGSVREIELYREETTPGKEVVVTQDIDLVKERVTETTPHDIELAYEELVVTPTDRAT